jgi:hypothetical protein
MHVLSRKAGTVLAGLTAAAALAVPMAGQVGITAASPQPDPDGAAVYAGAPQTDVSSDFRCRSAATRV